MALQVRRIRHKELLKKRSKFAARFPYRFAAYTIVKHMARAHAPRKPVRSASVFYDKRNAALGMAIKSEFARRGIKTRTLSMTPVRAAKISPEERRKVARMSRADSVVFAATDRYNEFEKLTHQIAHEAEKRYGQKRGTRLAMMYGITPSATRAVLTVDAKPMRMFTRKTFEAVNGSGRIRVQTPNGTDITFGLSRKLRWVADKGVITKSYWGNLPAGEVFTSPLTANGTLVLDGVMNNVGMLERAPIRVQVRNGWVVPESVECRNERLRKRFLRAISEDRNAGRIGELGLGTNIAVRKLTGIDLVDEKSVGVHVAFGDPCGVDTGARWKSDAHNDAILRKPTITVDGRAIMHRGRTLLEYVRKKAA